MGLQRQAPERGSEQVVKGRSMLASTCSAPSPREAVGSRSVPTSAIERSPPSLPKRLTLEATKDAPRPRIVSPAALVAHAPLHPGVKTFAPTWISALSVIP